MVIFGLYWRCSDFPFRARETGVVEKLLVSGHYSFITSSHEFCLNVFWSKKKKSKIAFTKQCFLVMCLLHYQGWKKYLNSSFRYGQLAPKCFFPRVMVCLFLLSFFMTWLANNLPYTRLACLPVWQVTRKSYMP